MPSSIAAELAVSRHPVRDALRELAAEGFVRLDSGGGAVVRELCRSELEDIYEIRAMLEPVATARAASSATRASLLPAIGLLAAMESETDATRWARFNSSFHSTIDGAGSSPRMAAILTNLRELSVLYITHALLSVPHRAERADAEHEQILQAVLARDPVAAADAALRHLQGTLDALRTVHEIPPAPMAGTPVHDERPTAGAGKDRGRPPREPEAPRTPPRRHTPAPAPHPRPGAPHPRLSTYWTSSADVSPIPYSHSRQNTRQNGWNP